MRTKLITVLLIILGFNAVSQEDTGSSRKKAINIYLDCEFCDFAYIKDNVSFVNYVRDTNDAQVHILITKQNAGNGGEEYSFFFMGQNEFKGKNDTLKFVSLADNTSDEIRQKQIRIMKLGLMYYVAHSKASDLIEIKYSNSDKKNEVVEDKWKSWIFSLNMSGYLNGDSNYKFLNAWANTSAKRITNDWKIELEGETNYGNSTYMIDGVPLIIENTSSAINTLTVKSLTEHWSYGMFTHIGNSTFNNYKIQSYVSPAIEYNLFPYSESTLRQLRFLYSVGYGYNSYNDTTIYDKTEEALFAERLEIAYEVKQKWGSVSMSVEEFAYLPDYTKNKLSFHTSTRVRLFKGFSVYLSGRVALIHDQIYLPKGGVSLEETLLKQQQLETQYEYWASFGLSYSFGSIYNNVVNPRFGD